MQQKDNNTLDNKKTEMQNNSAVRPHHHTQKIEEERNGMFKLRNILNIVFMILAVAGVIVYMLSNYHNTAVMIMIIAVVIKFVEVSLRLFHK